MMEALDQWFPKWALDTKWAIWVADNKLGSNKNSAKVNICAVCIIALCFDLLFLLSCVRLHQRWLATLYR